MSREPSDSDLAGGYVTTYDEMLESMSRSLKVNSLFFKRVGLGMNMSSEYADQLARDLKRISDEYKADSS